MALRAITQGFWWPYMQKDAIAYATRCEKCQKFSKLVNQPAKDLNPLTSPWPFAQWGLDLVGPFPKAPGNKRYMITVTDYFTKWVEAKPLASITDNKTKKFVWECIITRFGIPYALISDNGTQFNSAAFKSFCAGYRIKNFYSSVAYPQANGQAEATNKVILDGIKKRLDQAKGKWAEELPAVLWAYRTTPRRSTGESPFTLTYGSEAIIPLEVGLPTIRTQAFEQEDNERSLQLSLDLLQERREASAIRLAAYQQELTNAYSHKVRPRSFQIGDYVLRKVLANTKDPTDGKLGPNWEGPYRIIGVGHNGAYQLETADGKTVPRTWNTSNLRKFYI